MGTLFSLSQTAHGALNNVKGQSRILEAEIKIDASRGQDTSKKEKKLEKLNEQAETAQNYLTEAINQDSESAKKFLDSVKETMDKINEEAQKRQEEKEDGTEEITQPNTGSENGWGAVENGDAVDLTGTIVDIVIPSTVVTGQLSAAKNNDAPQDATIQVEV